MKNNLSLSLFSLILSLILVNSASAQWKPAGDKIKTKWAEQIDPNNVLPEYPRPIMQRGDWANLNGLWNYAILPAGSPAPVSYQGKILVPFCVESSLSGVQKNVGKDNELWYEREFTVPVAWKGKTVLLHFGAVDFKADVWVNDIKVGSHEGGYTPFSFDITPFLNNKGSQNLKVLVWDPTNDGGVQAVGKQHVKPDGIWYTPVTGIWQTVWMEGVNPVYIEDIKITPDLDKSLWNVSADVVGAKPSDIVSVVIKDKNGMVVSQAKSVTGEESRLCVENPELWSPESPTLYDVEIELISGGKVVDKVNSYCAMRKISTKQDENGIFRIQLNNKDYFQFGPLDQGWWCDGLYTAPTDEALKYDIEIAKKMGFNMIRKHVKVEPARWYTHCDEMGILVWQDMPSGDINDVDWQNKHYYEGSERVRSAASEALYRKEWKNIMDFGHNYPSIVVWVPFNEAWGQFKTAEITEWTKNYDPSRLVNSASGGNFFPVGDIMDLHNYPAPAMYLYDGRVASVLGEYGGIGMAVEGHLWLSDRNWGYVQFKSVKEVTDEYVKYAKMLKDLVKKGFSAAVYTQTTDVEGEVNGLMTYDRKVIKLEPERVRQANMEVINELNE